MGPSSEKNGDCIGTEEANALGKLITREHLDIHEQHFRDMIDALPAAIYTTDAQGRLTYFNPAAVEFSGRIPELGTDQWCVSWKLFHPDGTPLPHAQCPMAIALTEGRILRGVEAIAERPDGSRIWFTPYPTPLRNAEGHIIGGINMLMDITERKEAERATAHLAAIVASSDDAIISKDLTGTILSWNTGAEGIFGYQADEMIGQSIQRLIPTQRLDEEPQILGRISKGDRLDHYETIRRRKDGQLIDISLTVSPIKDAHGHIVGASKIARDITDQKIRHNQQRHLFEFATTVNRAEAMAELYEKALDALVHSLHADRAAILLFDPDGRLRFKAFRGLSADYRRAVEGHCPWERNDPSPHEIVLPNVDEAELDLHLKTTVLKEGIRAVAFIPLTYGRRLIGKVMVYFDQPHELPDRDRQVAHVITNTLAFGIERKRNEEALRASEEQLQRWSQELEQRVAQRTTELQHSQSRLRALATELNLAEQRERKRIATELHDHLQQLLVLGKLKMGQGKRLLTANPACLNVMTEADEVLTQALRYTRTLVAELSPPVLLEHGLPAGLKWLGEQMRHHHMNVTVECTVDDLRLPEEQAVLLFQSVRELLLNAAKHAESGSATVRLEKNESGLHIEVQDQGKGFDPTATANPQATTAVSSKFGLFSIRERMKALGGSLNMESTPGAGTTATLELPLGVWAERPEPHSKVSQLRRPPAAASVLETKARPESQLLEKTVRVLLVDDHAMMRQGLRSVLEAYSDVEIVGEAADGQEAIALVAERQPSVVLMDINLPKVNGIEATARIKSQYPEIKVIGLSVNAERENQEAMMQAGATKLITKEAAVDELYRAIQEVTMKAR